MKRIGYWSAILTCLFVLGIRAQSLSVASTFPIERLSSERNVAPVTVLAFMPSLTYDCEYASMLTQSFHYYFERGLAFDSLAKKPTIKIFIVVNDKENAGRSTQNILGNMNVIYDAKGELFTELGANLPASKNADSTIVLLGKDQKVAFIDAGYRAQGEHLKPLERKIKELAGFRVRFPFSKAPELKVGDPAPDFLINPRERLSDLRGRVVLLTFYPAAFSGTIPPPAMGAASQRLPRLSLSDSKFQAESMSCSVQIRTLDRANSGNSGGAPRRIAITSSTQNLLAEWKNLLKTHDMEYSNDADYSIASRYSAFDPAAGYNRRLSVIIDKRGRIAYIDRNYSFEAKEILDRKIDELNK